MLCDFIAKLVFSKDTVEYVVTVDENGRYTDSGMLYLNLKQMLKDGRINEAENMLFNRIDFDLDVEYLEIALDFYSELGNMSDGFLEQNDFSREEALEGLNEVKKRYGIEDQR